MRMEEAWAYHKYQLQHCKEEEKEELFSAFNSSKFEPLKQMFKEMKMSAKMPVTRLIPVSLNENSE